MKSLNLWTIFKSFKVEVENQLNKDLRLLDLTVVVNTMVYMLVQVNNVWDLSPST